MLDAIVVCIDSATIQCYLQAGSKLLNCNGFNADCLMCRLTANAIAVYRNKTSVFEYAYAGGTHFPTAYSLSYG